MNLLPEYTNGSIKDGTVINGHPFCLTNCGSKKCLEYYNRIQNYDNGIYSCPHGLSTIIVSDGYQKRIFTSLKEQKTYCHEKASHLQPKDTSSSPKLEYSKLLSLAEAGINLEHEKASATKNTIETNNLLHEIRKINAQVKNICDIVDVSDFTKEELLTQIKNIHVCSYLIYNRFQYYDAEANPTLNRGQSHNGVIFQKFDKMRKLLKGYLRKNVWISLDTQSRFEYPIFPTFETLLFILLENAIKYSPNSKSVNVVFDEPNSNTLYVSITSSGPYCNPDELLHIRERGFRGSEAQKTSISGQGLGLCFAQRICDEHHIGLEFSSKYTETIKSVDYGIFTAKLLFQK